MVNKPPSFIFSIRFVIALIALFGYAVQYMQRINMSVAIVCMVNSTALTQQKDAADLSRLAQLGSDAKSLNQSNQALADSQCRFQPQKGAKSLDGEFIWAKEIQGFILAAYFYGYLTTQIVGGFLSIRFGAKIVLAIAILIGSLLTLAIPVAANISYMALIACRFLIGVAHGSFWPAMSTLWSRWAPPTERSRLVAIANAGAQIGNVVALPLGGYLCVNGFADGWPSIFYVFGCVGLCWFVLWMVLVSKSPEEHHFISEREKEYIVEQTKEGLSGKKESFLRSVKNILSSKSFYGLLISHTASNFGVYLFLTQLPSYMKEVLKFDIKSNGLLSALPYIAFWLLTIVSSIVGDKLIASKKLSKTAVRKILNSFGFVVPAIAIVALGFVTCADPYIGVLLVVIGLAFNGCAYGAGYMVNYNDVAGSYAGLTFGLSNTISTVSGIVAPYIVGLITTNQRQEEWQLVFFITAAVYIVGALGFIVLGSGELEPWAKKQPNATKNEEELTPLQK